MKKILVSTILLILLTSCGQVDTQVKKYYSTRQAQESKIDIKQSFVGYVESDITTYLSSEVGGEVLSMPIKVGQQVKVGDIIASINVDTSSVAYEGGLGVLASLADMKQSIAESFDTQITVTQSQLSAAKIELQAAQTALTDTQSIHEKQNIALESGVELAQESIDSAVAEKEQLENIFATKQATLYSNAKDAMTALMIIDTNINTYIDEIFGLTKENDYKNDQYYQFLGAKDIQLKEDTRNKAFGIQKKFFTLKDAYESKIHILGTPSTQDIHDVLTQAIEFNDELKTFLSDMFDVFDTSIESEPYFGANVIEGHKTKLSNYGQQIEQALISSSGDMLLGVKGTLESLQALEDEKQKSLTLLDKKIILAQTGLENTQKNADIQPASQQLQLNQTQTKIALSQEKIKQIEESLKSLAAAKKARLDEINSQIANTKAQTNIQQLSAQKGLITSPITGVVTKKMADLGTVVGPGQQLVEVSDTSSKKVMIEVSEEIRNTLKLSDSVGLLFDGQDTLITGKVSMIYPFQDEKTRKTKIEIRTQDIQKIPLGSRAKVFLSKQTATGVTIPKKAIVQNYALPGVYVVRNNKAVFTHIDIIEQNDDVALVRGIQKTDELIVLGKENIFDGEDLSNYSQLPE